MAIQIIQSTSAECSQYRKAVRRVSRALSPTLTGGAALTRRCRVTVLTAPAAG